MRSFKLFWNLHKWTGLVLALVFACTAVTGFLLLIKKRVDWIQPPTQTGAAGDVEQFIGVDELVQAVLAQGHPDFRTFDDIDRVDFRPGKRVHKVRSRHHHAEIQVCAVTGEVLGVGTRPSDLLESIHDGSFFGDWAHDWVMPVVSAGLLFLVCTGVFLWLEPKVRRRRWRRRRAAVRAAQMP
jgi:uncharacterized iron-regulated membrane protein